MLVPVDGGLPVICNLSSANIRLLTLVMTTLGEGLLGGVVTLFSLGATQTPAPLKPSGGNPPLLVRWLKTSIVGKDRHISFAVQLHHFGLCP